MAGFEDYFAPATFIFKDPYGRQTGEATREKGNIAVSAPLNKKSPEPLLKLSRPSLDDTFGFKITENPLPIQTIEQDQVSAAREQATATRDLTETVKTLDQEAVTRYRKEQLMAASAKFGLDLMNTANQYRNVSGAARFNIMQARNQAADALYRGRQAAFERQSEGIRAGEQALLAMAAQGQSVDSESVQKIQRSYEAVGIENSMREEINGIREALGFQLEEVGQEYQLKQAALNRDLSMISSGLEFAVKAASYKEGL